MKVNRKLLSRFFLFIFLPGFILFNIIAYNHVYKFTHFTGKNVLRIQDSKQLPLGMKLQTLFLGIDNPKTINTRKPNLPYKEITIQSTQKIAGWYIKAENPKGTFLICHGYSGPKSKMIERASILVKMGYNALLIDFQGCGDSEGNETTLGYKEAEDVKAGFDFLKNQGENKIFLLGTSMGSAAIMRAVAEKNLKPVAIVLECPFGTMYDAVAKRFELVKLPSFLGAGILMFWGSVQTDFWAFSHNPDQYAKKIKCPSLLIFGEKDDRVERRGIDKIYQNLSSKKQLKTFPNVGHTIFPEVNAEEWEQTIEQFLKGNIVN